MTVLATLAAIQTLLTGVQSDAGKVMTRFWTDPPEQPQPADFPSCVIEHSPDFEGVAFNEAMGLMRYDYQVQIMVFVGTPSVTPMGELHNAAASWIKPITERLVTNQTLGAEVMWTGYGDGVQLRWWIQPINWNNATFYGLRILTGVTEKIPTTMG